MDFDFLSDTYDSERLKTLSVWVQFRDADWTFRPEPRARTPHEHMVHQCLSEDAWMSKMLGLEVDRPALPASEERLAFVEHYADLSERRLAAMRRCDADWYRDQVSFFGVPRPRAWVLVRRFTHSAHHRGQLTTYLRLLGRSLYSTYGPSADTGGLPANGAAVVYPSSSIAALLQAARADGPWTPLPGSGLKTPTERPDKEQ